MEESLRQMIIQGVADTALVESTELREKRAEDKRLRNNNNLEMGVNGGAYRGMAKKRQEETKRV